MSIRFRLITLFLIIGFTKISFAQNQGFTPYGGFGVGEISSQTVAAQDMMGGAGVSNTNTFYTNLLNPALVVKNRTIGAYKYVSLNVSLKGNYNNLTQGANLQENFGLHLNNISMVFPAKPKWAMAVSFRPYSSADYESINNLAVNNSTYLNNIDSKSSGGLSRFSYINSVQIGKQFYVGIEAQSTFGSIMKDTTTSITDGTNVYSNYNRNSSRVNLHNKSLKLGVGYTQKLYKNWKLNLGGFYQMGGTLKGQDLRTHSILANTGNGLNYIQKIDTLSLLNIKSQLPQSYKIGASIEKPYNWVFALDYGITKWQGVTQYDKIAQAMYINSTEINAGVEWLPNASSSNYFGQAFYRAGFKHTQTPYVISNTKIQDNSFSLGISLPMGFKSSSYIDLGAAVGRRGVNANSVIQENYVKMSISFNLLNHTWFTKPKID